jgi:hypothetical protein
MALMKDIQALVLEPSQIIIKIIKCHHPTDTNNKIAQEVPQEEDASTVKRQDIYQRTVLTKIIGKEAQDLQEIEMMEIIKDQEKMGITNSIEKKLVVITKLHLINLQQEIGELTAQ